MKTKTHKLYSRTEIPGIRTLLPFLKSITEDSNLTNFIGLVAAVDTSFWMHKVIS